VPKVPKVESCHLPRHGVEIKRTVKSRTFTDEKNEYRTAEYRMSNVEVKKAKARPLRHSEFGVRYSTFAFNWGRGRGSSCDFCAFLRLKKGPRRGKNWTSNVEPAVA